jgi:16S rRNA (adenine1518-N6/adenine1519-N6)-dimethyltransferase
MTVTVQLEVGERLVSREGKSDYGPLSVLLNQTSHARIVRTLPPTVFWPRPKVTSAIVQIDVRDDRLGQLDRLREMNRFVRELFMHRRKSLRAGIARIPGYKQLKPMLSSMLDSIGLGGDVRAEQLDSRRLETLFDAIRHLRDDADASSDLPQPADND